MYDGAFDSARVGSYRVGVDIGGTFTDIVLLSAEGDVMIRKVLSSPDDYSRAIIEAIQALLAELGLDPGKAQEVVHGTTICTNAILEQKGARTGLLTTQGLRDVLEIGRLRYPRLYDLTWMKPPPLVERRWRLEVPERLDRSGEVVQPLDEATARQAIDRLLDEGIESLAICLLHSYANPEHEQRLGALVGQAAPGLPVSLSSAVLPEIGEYERSSTTVINAYVQPVVRRYLATLTDGLAGLGMHAPVWVMQSNGGIMSAQAAGDRPIHIVESGPAAGAIAALDLAGQLDLPNVIALDMGGTTAKASIIEDGQLHQAAEYEVGAGLNVGARLNRGAGYILRVPAIDIAEVGAGGGSLVWLDAGGLLHVGPQSAGSVPGPVCYRNGGVEPTLTDANLLLGYLNSEALLGGALPIDRDYAEAVFTERVARPLGVDVLTAAYGVHRIGVANMVRVVKAVSSERGRDPRSFSLVAYGGNGPLHAALVAAELGMPRIVVPPWPGLFSAFGLLYANLAHHYSRTILRPTRSLTPGQLEDVFQDLTAQATETMAKEGYGRDQIQLTRALDLRYVGQSFELRLPVDAEPFTAALLCELDRRFGAEHERTYGHRADGDPVEVVNVRVTAAVTARIGGRGSASGRQSLPSARGDSRVGNGAAPSSNRLPVPDFFHPSPAPRLPAPDPRLAYFGADFGHVQTLVLGRHQVGAEALPGPIIVEEYDATTIVPPGWTVRRDRLDNLIVEMGGNR